MEKLIGNRLRQERMERRLTQTEVAVMAGVSRPYYADVEMGRYTPSLKLLVKLSVIISSRLRMA